ncbi:MAG: 16S rRNA (guanine(527)-N(7))-methyltransferase RsmG [Betaproteobacteria bacterium]|nr:16S rRNA (guanine(527)-N(7))-methyltransferase RsmG [Betaproteobacteria bacterium]
MILEKEIAHNLSALEYDFPKLDMPLEQSVMQYLLLIEKWNRIHNLTAIRNLDEMFIQHIMDSLAVLPHINGPQIVDIGTGAGLPGIPIALARPDWPVTLVESNTKKTTFLQQVKIEMGLKNVEIVTKRIEEYQPREKFNTIITRAFSNLGAFIDLSKHLNHSHDHLCKWCAMKADCTDQELKQIATPFVIDKIINIPVPGLVAKRQLIVIKRLN